MKSKFVVLALAAPLLFVACENPADKTATAAVSEPVEKLPESPEVGTKYVFTPSSEVLFVGSKVTGKHDGGFKTFSGYFTVRDGAPVGSDHKVVIDMNSVFSDDEKLTAHLKSADFFEVETYPESVFEVTGVTRNDNGNYSLSGNFKLHGVTKNITFPATVTQDGETVRIDAEFDINRKDFGIVYAGKADDLIRDEVVIKLKLEAQPEA